MYVCGVTVYDDCHIGHARVATIFDSLVRFLVTLNLSVVYVRNITDVDDKIINKAKERKCNPADIANQYIASMHSDYDSLGLLRPTQEPLATRYLINMFECIQILLDKKVAYATTKGDIYFSVSAFKDYGKLSKRSIEDMFSGVRVLNDENKKHPEDFALWKIVDTSDYGYQSPFGVGRPGWHIECSAMARTCLGEQIDIHGGGNDLIFPHHENEIAQTESITNKTFASHWLHVGFVNYDNKKMSKSLGNTLLIKQFRKLYSADTLRYFMLSTHYRSPINYHHKSLSQAVEKLTKIQTALHVDVEINSLDITDNEFYKEFINHLLNDFNTPEALQILHLLAHEIHTNKSKNRLKIANHLSIVLKILCSYLGLFSETTIKSNISKANIEELVAKRNIYRTNGDYKNSDIIRNDLLEQGVILEDGPLGTSWRYKL